MMSKRWSLPRPGRGIAGLALATCLVAGSWASAQSPSIEVGSPPGLSGRESLLGRPIGSARMGGDDSAPGNQGRPIGGRPGPSSSRAPVGGLNPPGGPPPNASIRSPLPVPLEPQTIPRLGELDLPSTPEEAGPEGGLTLDSAIETLLSQNLALMALKFEIPMAEADVLTASLRANPVFYADSQLVPYGHYSNGRPGGQTQYDVNITYPLDLSRKRIARTVSARKAKLVTEAQFQDAIRLEIDNLYTAFVDVVASRETLRYTQTYAEGIEKLLILNQDLYKQGHVTVSSVDALKSLVEQAQLQVRESRLALGKTTRALALLLNIPREQAESLSVKDTLRDARALSQDTDSILNLAVANRPDLAAYRLGLDRANADVKLAKANRFSDAYLLVQPYTFQDNRAIGLKSAYSWAVGVTVPIPVHNRNQGNIERAKLNVSQTQVQLSAYERRILSNVDEAIREFQQSLDAMVEIETEIIPASRRVRDSAFRRFQGGESDAIEYLNAQKDYNEVVRQYRDALVRHRRSMLDLNTAVGVRILP